MTEKERLERLMEYEHITPTQFADRIGIQRSTLSHIMKGRNAPSLDVLQKTLNVFRSVNTDWLILGVGPMYRTASNSQQTLFDIKPEIEKKELETENIVVNENKEATKQSNKEQEVCKVCKTITKVVVFYSDNTFEELTK